MQHTIRRLALSCLISLLCPFAGAATTHYTLTDLGTFGGSWSDVSGINDAGQAVGEATTANNATYHAFVTYGNQLRDLGVPPGWAASNAHALNATGHIVGEISNGLDAYHAMFFGGLGTSAKDLGTLGGTYSSATAINSSDQIVGWSQTSAGAERAFLYSNGQMTDIGSIPGYSSARAQGVNDAGQIVGTGQMGNSGNAHAFLYSNGHMTDLGTLGGQDSLAYAINNHGQIVGTADPATGPATGYPHAFLYSSGQMHDLGTLGSGGAQAYALNDLGQVVGYGYIPTDGYPHAFLYAGSGPLLDLNSLVDNAGGLTVYQANGINDNGQIVGIASNNHAVLLSPVPEPAGSLMLLLFTSTIASVKRHRHP